MRALVASVFVGAACVVCGTAGGGETEASAWRVTVDPGRPIGPVSPVFAGANVNRGRDMLIGRPDFDEGVAALNIRMMRLQAPDDKLDYKEAASWNDETFASMDEAVEKARNVWGVQRLMFGIHRISMPYDEGRLVEEDFPLYADACAKLVERYAPPGNMRVEYWETFNEQDHSKHLDALAAHGQSYKTVLALYRLCAQRMKAVNPDIKVGGPALCAPVSSFVRDFLKTCGDTVDFVSWHDYATGNAETSDDAVLLRVTQGKRFLPAVRRIEEVLDECGRAELPMFMTEFHINYAAWRPRDDRVANQFTAVFTGSVLANLASTRLQSAMIHDLVSHNYGLLGPASFDKPSRALGAVFDSADDDPLHVRPVGWVYRWFNQLVGGEWVECRMDLPPEDASGPRGRLLDACAWSEADQWGVLLVNKDTKPHPLVLHGSCPATSEAFALPMRVFTIVDGRPHEAHTPGTREGVWQTDLPPMSVTFLIAPKTGDALAQ